MPSYTVHAKLQGNSAQGLANSSSVSQAVADAGTGFAVGSTIVQSSYFAGGGKDPTYWQYNQGLLQFDTSGISVGETVTGVTLYIAGYPSGSNSGSMTLEVRAYDWGGTITGAAWHKGSTISSLNPMLASFTMGTWQNEPTTNTFTSNGTNFNSAIVKGGITRIILTSDLQRLGTTLVAPNIASVSQAFAGSPSTFTYIYIIVTTTSAGVAISGSTLSMMGVG